jgi:hypothetical protein
VRVAFALTLLTGCKEEKAEKPKPAPVAVGVLDRARAITEEAIRAAGWPNMRFRGEQVWEQAMPQHLALCGQLNPFAENPDLFVPFVSVITVPANPTGPAGDYQFEHHIGSNTNEASHVYAALVDYCYDKGGPSPGPVHNVMATPPLPDTLPNVSAKTRLIVLPPAASVMPGLSSTSATPASGMVTMRQAANLHTDPHGPSIRVVPQGTPLRVFGQAPGGWLQVGDSAPFGWMHESMTDRR